MTGCSHLPRGRNLNLLGDGPHERAKLSGDSRYNDRLGFSLGPQPSIARAQPKLSLPGDIANLLADGFLALEQNPADPGREAVRPGGLHQKTSDMNVARFGDGSPPGLLPAGMLRWHQAKKAHKFGGVFKAGEVAELGYGCGRHNQRDATKGLKRFDNRRQAPLGHQRIQLLSEPLHAKDLTELVLQLAGA